MLGQISRVCESGLRQVLCQDRLDLFLVNTDCFTTRGSDGKLSRGVEQAASSSLVRADAFDSTVST